MVPVGSLLIRLVLLTADETLVPQCPMIRSEDHVAAGASRRWPWWELSRSAGDKQCRRVTGDKLSKLPLKANFTYSSRLLFINGQYIVPSLSRNFIAELWFHLAIAK